VTLPGISLHLRGSKPASSSLQVGIELSLFGVTACWPCNFDRRYARRRLPPGAEECTDITTCRPPPRLSQNVVRAEVQENKTATRRRRMVEKRQERQIEAGIDFPTKDEIRAMMSVPDRRGRHDGPDPADLPRRPIPAWHALVVTAILSVLPASELRGLKWANVNFKQKQIEVRQRADRFNQIGNLKSRAGLRDIPVGPTWSRRCSSGNLQCPAR
jgi:integrase